MAFYRFCVIQAAYLCLRRSRNAGTDGRINMKKAYFAGGCFWCITPAFKKIAGVAEVISGYSGGDAADAVYEKVKRQETFHRETICVEYDPQKVTFSELVNEFFARVDPFDGEGQFIDRGRSYTLAVYCNDAGEEKIVAEKIAETEKKYGKKVFVALEKFTGFYPAEEYHQDYYIKNPEAFEEELVSSGRKK